MLPSLFPLLLLVDASSILQSVLTLATCQLYKKRVFVNQRVAFGHLGN